MQALILALTVPILPLWSAVCCGKRSGDMRNPNKREKMSGAEMLLRYAAYLLVITLMVTCVMVFLCDEGTSLWQKADASPMFVLKFAAVECFAAVLTAVSEWLFARQKVRFDFQAYAESFAGRVLKKAAPYAIYLLAAVMVIFNVSLTFDNVLWGDECFSANTARKDWDGILQVLYFWDNHPPLHYYWIKIFGELLGHTGWVYHLASMTPYFVGVVMALTVFRKHFGKIPTAFFVILTGVASTCLRNNLEIRMYSLAFLGVLGCYYCAYRAVCGGRSAWIGMVFWGLVGAYSHYYAMMAAGIIIFITGVAAVVRFGKKTWIKAFGALAGYILGYAPWFKYLFHGTKNVSGNWWMTEIMGLPESMKTVLCGVEYEWIVLWLCLISAGVLFIKESGIVKIGEGRGLEDGHGATGADGVVRGDKGSEDGHGADGVVRGDEDAAGGHIRVEFRLPRLREWSDEAYGAAIGWLSIAGLLIAAYLLCLVVGPVLTGRYLYPISAVTTLLLPLSLCGMQRVLGELFEKYGRAQWKGVVRAALLVCLCVMLVIGVRNYRICRTEVKSEQAVTEQALRIIGDVDEDTVLMSNNVKHLAWTVLYYYYPKRDVRTGNATIEGFDCDKFWYFTPEKMYKGEIDELKERGYRVEDHGQQQIATYPFALYYIEKE